MTEGVLCITPTLLFASIFIIRLDRPCSLHKLSPRTRVRPHRTSTVVCLTKRDVSFLCPAFLTQPYFVKMAQVIQICCRWSLCDGGSARAALPGDVPSLGPVVSRGCCAPCRQVFEILLSRGYAESNFREDLKNLYLKLGIENKMMIFLFTDAHMAEEGFLELINNILTSGTGTLVSHGVCWSPLLSFQRRPSDKRYLFKALPTCRGGVIQALTGG